MAKGRTPYESEENMVQNIMECFDFEKCLEVMKFLNWTWGNDFHTPSLNEMREEAEKRLRDAISYAKTIQEKNTPCYSSSGGFKATVWKNKYGHIIDLELEFIVSSWSHDDDY